MSMRHLEDIVERVVRGRFSAGAVHSVKVSHDVDDDGDRILRIVVFCDKAFDASDERKMLGLVRHVRSELAAVENDEFPMIDFVSGKDSAKIRREFA